MTDFEFGDTVLVPFPFSDQTAAKKRPAVVISSAAYHKARPDVVLMAVTSQARPEGAFGHTPVRYWTHAGLLKPSVVKPVATTVQKDLVIRKLGRLHPDDRETLRATLSVILGSQE